MKNLLLISLLSAGILSTSIAGTNNEHSRKGFNPEMMFDKLDSKLDLTKDQEAKIHAIFENVRKSHNKSEQAENHSKFADLVYTTNYDEKAVSSLIDQKSQERKTDMLEMAKAQHDAYMVLTPAQQVEFKKYQEEFASKRMQHKKDKANKKPKDKDSK